MSQFGLGHTVPVPGRREVFVYRVDTDDGERDVVSTLDPGWVFAQGLGLATIIGYLRGGAAEDVADLADLGPADFEENPAFRWLFSRAIYEDIGEVEGIRLEAAVQGKGHVYLLDGRTPDPGGRVPPEDIVGSVRVADGVVVPGSYQHNPRHRLLTANGFFQLPPELEAGLARRLRAPGPE